MVVVVAIILPQMIVVANADAVEMMPKTLQLYEGSMDEWNWLGRPRVPVPIELN